MQPTTLDRVDRRAYGRGEARYHERRPARSLRVAIEAAEVVLAADVVGVRVGVGGGRSGRGGQRRIGRRLVARLQLRSLQLRSLLHVRVDVDVVAAAALVGDGRVDGRVDGDLRRAGLRGRLTLRGLRGSARIESADHARS